MALLAAAALALTAMAIYEDLTLRNGPDVGPTVVRLITSVTLLAMLFEAALSKWDLSRLTDRSKKDAPTSGAPLS